MATTRTRSPAPLLPIGSRSDPIGRRGVAYENSEGDWDKFFDSLSPEQQDVLLELEPAIVEIQNELLALVDAQIKPYEIGRIFGVILYELILAAATSAVVAATVGTTSGGAFALWSARLARLTRKLEKFGDAGRRALKILESLKRVIERVMRNVDDIRDRLSFSGKGKQNSNASKAGKCDIDSGKSRSTEVPPDGKDKKPDSDGDGRDTDTDVDPLAPKNVRDTLKSLPGKSGKTGLIKEVPDAKALDDLFDLLSRGGKTVNPGTYPGIVKELPDGTIIRRRPGSRSGGATIDITMPDGTIIKVHIKS